jgi:hypothetical protein
LPHPKNKKLSALYAKKFPQINQFDQHQQACKIAFKAEKKEVEKVKAA